MQTVGEIVEIGEAGRHTGQLATAGGDGLHLVEGRLHQLGERFEVLADPALGDRVDLGLGAVDDLVDIALGRVRHLVDPDRRVDQPAQDRLLPDDLGVVAGVRGERHRGQQSVQVGEAAGPGQLAALGQLVTDGDRVGRLAAPVQVDDGVEDHLVRRPVEVGASERLDDVGDGVLAQQHRAEHALLGGQILRRCAVQRSG